MPRETLIIGGGLAGLRLADLLANAGHDALLLEARARFGGRVMTQHLDDGGFDLGPTWFWPGQPRIAALADSLGLARFDQYATGDLMYENAAGQMQRARGHAAMEGSYRLNGGMQALTNALADRLHADHKRLNATVSKLERHKSGITAHLASGETIDARRVVLALPPRLAADQITFIPAFPDAVTTAMQDIPTWMAGQAKVIAVFDSPFWRAAGLSGDAMSHLGPMVEVHDASPAQGGPFALFGFIGTPPQARRDAASLRAQIIAQFIRMFGPNAAAPRQVYLKDWACDPLTATPRDHEPLFAHPAYGLPQPLTNLWDGSLLFGNSEIAPQFGGYLEGALEAAENAMLHLTQHFK